MHQILTPIQEAQALISQLYYSLLNLTHDTLPEVLAQSMSRESFKNLNLAIISKLTQRVQKENEIKIPQNPLDVYQNFYHALANAASVVIGEINLQPITINKLQNDMQELTYRDGLSNNTENIFYLMSALHIFEQIRIQFVDFFLVVGLMLKNISVE